ncbi:MAG: Subtilisin-like serine protease, partial [Chthonomonadales bacterium]|nr:Subtilisin-like serine protease [Chthonomonadales bacterium]
MIHRPRLRHLGRALAFAALFATGAAQTAFGQAVKTIPGEIILYMQPGTDQNVATTLANTVNPVSVTPLLLKDCYLLKLPQVHANVADTATAVATLKMNPNVRWVNANEAVKLLQTGGATKLTPNDPRFNEQWGLTQINMPQAWTLQKGAVNVNVADVDSGFDPLHEDLKGQYLPESFDFNLNTPNITAVAGNDHGVATSGVMIALTNNATGIAGVCWENIKCLGLKVDVTGSPGAINIAAALNAFAYITANKVKLHIVAVNLSFGGGGDPTDTSNPEYVATKAMVDAGVIVVGSAGNSGDAGNPINIPAYYPHVISVASTDRNGKTTGYSEFNKVEIAAPGGDAGATGVPANGILVTNLGSAYAFEDGTSFAAPHVTAAFGLLMSVPGVTPAQAKKAMFDTANRKGLALTTLPDAHYGFGVLDVYAALLQVSVSVVIDDPIGINAQG